MSKSITGKPLAFAVGAALSGSLLAAGAACAGTNPFALTELGGGYMQVADNQTAATKAPEAQCGGDKAAQGQCGGAKAAQGQCGAAPVIPKPTADSTGSTGSAKMVQAQCGGAKAAQGQCGAAN